MKEKLDAIKQVDTVTFSSKDKELKDLINSMGDEGQAFEPFEQQNPLNDVFVVKTKEPTDVAKVAKQIEKYPYAAKFNTDKIKLKSYLKC